MARDYQTGLTATENDKGVLDLDVVKGCSGGMQAHPDGGCYGSCYAARIAKRRGLDFGKSVSRYPRTPAEVAAMVRFIRLSPLPFVRIGVMGDPSHDWTGTARVARFVAPYKPVVIITKHWSHATDADLRALAHPSITVNTSCSALDTEAELAHRLEQHERMRAAGVRAFVRVISCDFDRSTPEGERMGAVQDNLFTLDNGRVVRCDALRTSTTNPLVESGIIRLRKVFDLHSEVNMSLCDDSIYIGRCDECPDLCGARWEPEGTGDSPQTPQTMNDLSTAEPRTRENP